MPPVTDDKFCRVCVLGRTGLFMRVDNRTYLRCQRCNATLLAANELPDADFEYARYLCHQNDPADPGYRRFLSRLADPLCKRLPSEASGLDYGCGPGPALASMLREAGHPMRLYDPFFYKDLTALQQTYDFITCTEVFEHFHHPAFELNRLNTLLRPGGCLGIMTCFQTRDDQFATWHYRRDETHVTFYREETFRCLASDFNWRCEFPCKDVVVLYKDGT